MLTDHVSIFQSRPDGNGYQLKDGIRFHLYINTAPCGDARIFSPHELEPSETKDGALNTVTDPHPNRKARGQLRTKIESGEGTIPVKSSDAIQTWDGVLQGSRLLTMSCSGMLLIFQSSFFLTSWESTPTMLFLFLSTFHITLIKYFHGKKAKNRSERIFFLVHRYF